MSGQRAAYAKFGVTLRNYRWSWSGRNSAGEVVLTLWKDHFDYTTSRARYSTYGDQRLSEWISRPGNAELIENLKYARDHCGGKFKVVVATAIDTSAEPREIDEAYPSKIVMQLVDLNENTGEFRAEQVKDT